MTTNNSTIVAPRPCALLLGFLPVLGCLTSASSSWPLDLHVCTVPDLFEAGVEVLREGLDLGMYIPYVGGFYLILV